MCRKSEKLSFNVTEGDIGHLHFFAVTKDMRIQAILPSGEQWLTFGYWDMVM